MKTHLCQASPKHSCGACCGLYNFHNRSPEATRTRLRAHTEAVQRIGYEDTEALVTWATAQYETEAPQRWLATLPTCVFVGFLDATETRVGCLLHPRVTKGSDLRDLGVYHDRTICENFLCPSFSWFRQEDVDCVLTNTDDWYLYGLSITDVDFLKITLRELSLRCGKEVRASQLQGKTSFQQLLQYKNDWPYRDPIRNFGSFAQRNGQECRAEIDYAALGAKPSRFDRLFLCLESHFTDADALHAAEDLLEATFAALEAELSG